MKPFKIISIVAFFISTYCLHAQTFIEAGIGVRFSNVDGYLEELPYYGIIPQNGFETRSPILNFGVVQNITKRLSLKGALEFGVENVAFNDFGFVGATDLRFDHYNLSLVPQYTIFNNIEIGLGMSYGILSDYELGKKDRNIWYPAGVAKNQNDLGWIASISYHLRPLTIALQYHQTNGEDIEQSNLIRQINSIEVLLSYHLQVGK